MFKYSYNALVYYGEALQASVERLARFGYDAVELVGEPGEYDFGQVRALTADYGLEVSSICSIFNAERDLGHPDAGVRARAVAYVREVAEMAAEIGAPTIIAAPVANMRIRELGSREDEWNWAVEGIRSAGEYAASLGVNLCIEAWNRFESYMLNRLDQAEAMRREVGLPNVGIMGDTFHMNIDETDIAEAIRENGDALLHIHLADSNRAAPGEGHTDFEPIIRTLRDIGYKGYLTFELLPAAADPFGVMKRGGGQAFFDAYTEQAIAHIKRIEEKLAAEAR
ncbi:sugar phosphate isomerase/epimerase [Paenibacillus rhizovicinus]|uniref:Sugar phosphate isomerase/epimerase n=1 Tax=Paenibacillus rhizovicinus TaxID=2704463 RepID=A0A6C0P0B5_9BACL|nr:sugar phosphate isomerase/epimerase family protein [Paenibacillus rhizovicinus]QHW31821.1 sugar phosphate isomerase/epimerase [Paenibacillus rhizovicinus]